jgi:hypothetical protein
LLETDSMISTTNYIKISHEPELGQESNTRSTFNYYKLESKFTPSAVINSGVLAIDDVTNNESKNYLLSIYVDDTIIKFGFDKKEGIKWIYEHNITNYTLTYDIVSKNSVNDGVALDGIYNVRNSGDFVDNSDTNYLNPFIALISTNLNPQMRLDINNIKIYGSLMEPDFLRISTRIADTSSVGETLSAIIAMPTYHVISASQINGAFGRYMLINTNRTYKLSKISFAVDITESFINSVKLVKNIKYSNGTNADETKNFTLQRNICEHLLPTDIYSKTGTVSNLNREFNITKYPRAEIIWESNLTVSANNIDLMDVYLYPGDNIAILIDKTHNNTQSIYTLYIDMNN